MSWQGEGGGMAGRSLEDLLLVAVAAVLLMFIRAMYDGLRK